MRGAERRPSIGAAARVLSGIRENETRAPPSRLKKPSVRAMTRGDDALARIQATVAGSAVPAVSWTASPTIFCRRLCGVQAVFNQDPA